MAKKASTKKTTLMPPSSRPVHEISEDLRRAIVSLILEAEENDGVIDNDAAMERLDAVSGELAIRLDGVEVVATEYEAYAAYANKEVVRITELGEAAMAHATRLRDLIEKSLRHSGTERLVSPTHEFAMVGKPPILEVSDEVKVPMQFRRCEIKIKGCLEDVMDIDSQIQQMDLPDGLDVTTTTSVDKPKVKKALKTTDAIPGVHLIDQRKRLRVK